MSNDYCCAILRDPIEGLLNNLLGGRVERTGSLIEKQYFGVRDNTSRDGNSLLLATAEATRPLPNLGTISLQGHQHR